MSKPSQSTTGGKPAPQPRTLAGSVWAKGPPQSQPASQTASPLQSPIPTKERLVPSDSATTSTPPSARQSQAGQPRKAAPPAAADAAPVTASKPLNIPAANVASTATPAKNPALNFGTIDNPDSVISSSPAAKPTTGAHLGEGEKVKSFGSVAAAAAAAQASTAANGPVATPPPANAEKPAPAPAAAAAPASTKPKFDPHKAFQKAHPQAPAAAAPVASPAPASVATPSPAPPAPAAASVSPGPVAPVALASPAPAPQQINPYANLHAQQQPGQQGIPQARGYNAQGPVNAQPFSPSGGPQNGLPGRGVPHRSPIMNNVPLGFNPNTAGFQPRPGRPAGQPMNRGGPGYPPQMQAPFPGMQQGYNPYQHAYGYGGEFQPQQFAYGQHYQGMPGGVGAPGQPGGVPPVGSPIMGRPQLHGNSSSFSSTTSGVPPAGGPAVASPMSPQPAPGTPMQVHRAPAVFTPNAPSFTPGGASFSPNIPSFTPGGVSPAAVRPKIAESRAIKITRLDGTAVDLSSEAKKVKGTAPSAATLAAAAASASPKPAVATPVVVRIESPVQKQERERELEAEKKRKEEDERAEKERKEAKEREEKEREDKERQEKEQKEAEEKERADKEKKEAEAAAAAAEEAEKKAEEEKKAAEKKAADEAEATKASDAAKAAAESAPAPEPVVAPAAAIAGLPSKPSTETLEKATLSAPDALGGKSATPSPRASPAISHATLPPKPEVAEGADAAASQTGMQRKGAPASLNLDSPAQPTASSLALKTAKVIEDIRAITYPTGTAPPNPALNESASSGKFRYDREFLLQFLNICKEKVPTEAPLELLGIDKDQVRDSGGFGRSGSQRGGQRASQMGGPRGAGMGSGMGSFQKGPGSMGQFGAMGSFSRPAQTSEERLAASRASMGAQFGAARNSQGGMSRTTSQAGPMGNMMQGGMRSDSNRTRSARGKQRGGEGRGPMTTTILDQNVAPLEASANRWTPSVQNRRPGGLDEGSPEFVERKVKGLLNKLTAEKFESISNQILEWANKSVNETDGQTLRLVIKLIFEKAKDEQFWSKMYASLCQKLWRDISPDVKDEQMLAADGKPLSGGLLFRKYLLNRCQEDFEKGWKQKADASAAAKEKAADDQKKKAEHDAAVEAGKEVEEFKFSDEYYAEQAAKRQGLGLVKFVGELFKLEILSTKVIHSCIVKLLSNVNDPDEEDVESLCQLLTTVGAKMEAQPKMAQQVQLYIQRMKDLAQSEHLTSRIKFMVQDVIELQSHRWQTRSTKGEGGPMTIEQVHAQARAEAEANRVAASHVNMSRSGDSASRGGSRRGQDRGGFSGGPGGDAWTSVGAKLPAKPADMSSFGKINAGSGPTSFGPNSIFGKKKGGKASGDTTPPPISRTPSSNMFSALEGHDGTAEPASPLTDGAPQQRKRLQLQPRTVSSTDVDKPDTPLNEQENMDAIAGAHVPPVGETDLSDDKGMSEEEIDRKIKNDVEELWGAKDQGGTRNPSDIAEYFQTLPESGRTKLAKKLIDDVFRIAKADDTQVVVKGFKLAIEKDLFTPAQAKDALLPSIELLDDLSLDIPLAYEFAADLMVVTKLPQSDVEALADAIESYGEPKITPKDKLLAAVEKKAASSA